jgi:hypothetical protein
MAAVDCYEAGVADLTRQLLWQEICGGTIATVLLLWAGSTAGVELPERASKTRSVQTRE